MYGQCSLNGDCESEELFKYAAATTRTRQMSDPVPVQQRRPQLPEQIWESGRSPSPIARVTISEPATRCGPANATLPGLRFEARNGSALDRSRRHVRERAPEAFKHSNVQTRAARGVGEV